MFILIQIFPFTFVLHVSACTWDIPRHVYTTLLQTKIHYICVTFKRDNLNYNKPVLC
jgi:hypothetical protein